ncbi:HpcH/HpaI aldolase/citrate lyase family protein [Pseudovibrio sp. Tun.PSC04-5.I4]|uniref:HpcH/HpaI aldolase/citrate lyase family protein n=1 Tax=Pseudovibrio sp. Tun.PSC04-5.I4 TaxID=1798213 RepID=UPI0008878AAA|nr:HpcH/HpaI aldolase/citrate lyase family protein [Pseudovibrio sp. Tun.PSC04-5.I4]SDQ86333.1 Citrate lyase beta subunit [Pseudovibrio sp. Tun.PSC04-5.I4]
MVDFHHMFSAYGLGATLYVPIIHHKVPDILTGRTNSPASSVVLCLEDALAESDVERAVGTLRELLPQINQSSDLRVFVRPRSLSMGHRLASFKNIDRIEGFVAPKVRPDTTADWMQLVSSAGLAIMPTLESADYFDPGCIVAFRDVLSDYDHRLVSAVRLGGNDFLGALGLRRERGMTSWEGPLGWVLSMCSSMLISAGYPVAAPVFDIIDDPDTLRREVQRDVAAGFVSKTVIHPCQVPIIVEGMKVSEQELQQAKAIIEKDALAVFQIGGAMCEPATHSNWARRVLARERIFGCKSASSPGIPMRVCV